MKFPLYITDHHKNYYLVVEAKHALTCNFLHEIATRANNKELNIMAGIAHTFYVLFDKGIVVDYHIGKIFPDMHKYVAVGWLFTSDVFFSEYKTSLLPEITKSFNLNITDLSLTIEQLINRRECVVTYENIGTIILTNYGLLLTYKEVKSERVLVPLITTEDVYIVDGKVPLHLLDEKTLFKFILQRRFSSKELQLTREFYVST